MLQSYEEVLAMRFIGIIIALGAIGWTLYQASGGGEADDAIPQEYREAVQKAEDVEATMNDALQKRMEELE